jgi:ATP-dependent Clp protease adaptor protein ClpS
MSDTITLPKPKKKEKEEQKTKRLPPYNVVLVNDDDHSVEYVVVMMQQLFGHPIEKGLKIAEEVHFQGRCIVWTGSLEVAELKQEQIHAFGPDKDIARCKGSMTAVVEPAA